MEELEECNVALTLATGGGGGRRGDRLNPEKKTLTGEEDRRSSEQRPGISIAGEREEEASDAGGEYGRIRKKLRLTEEQLAVLEDNFRAHTTLTPDQKQELALRLELQPRQVEVWFQNRRARTKSKQTETDCELLKKLCEGLRSENRRLKGELRELLELRSAAPAKLGGLSLFTELRRAARVMRICSSCHKMMPSSTADDDDDEKKRAVS